MLAHRQLRQYYIATQGIYQMNAGKMDSFDTSFHRSRCYTRYSIYIDTKTGRVERLVLGMQHTPVVSRIEHE